MSSGKNPLVLMMALSVPGAAHALGLGEIHVDSALNERLAAEIDIVGATELDLAGLRATLANRDAFLRYGAERPAFLSSATFKVTQDSQGRPVLAIRSTESFSEPVVNLLVDVTWRSGELVRQYTLLLDPPGFASPPAATPGSEPQAQIVATSSASTAAPTASTLAPAASTVAPTAASVAPPTGQPNSTTSTARAVRKTTHVKVGAKATLRGIAWRVGERSESDLQRMMLAIFRANPAAFDGNINRLHLGALLTIPSSAEVAEIPRAEAKREIRAQMAAWRTPARAVLASSAPPATPAATHVPAAAAAATSANAAPVHAAPVHAAPGTLDPADATNLNNAVASAPEAPGAEAPGAEAPAAAALSQRVKSLEQELSELKGVLKSENDQLQVLQQLAARVAQPAAVVEARQEKPKSGHGALTAILTGVGLLAAALAALYFRFRRREAEMRDDRGHDDAMAAHGIATGGTEAIVAERSQFTEQEPEQQQERETASTAADRSPDSSLESGMGGTQDVAPYSTPDSQQPDTAATQPLLPVLTAAGPVWRNGLASAGVSPAAADATVNMHVDTVNLRVGATRLDYNFLDLDMTAQHVQMPSVLNESAVVKERRTNLADVLKLAIEREPDRHDLRMKLLELYYSAAATNRQAFLDVVQKFARNHEYLPPDQWDKVAFMGRQIASESPLFAEESTAEDDDLANCA
jgi:pilus assembly protein FimV